jgi:hypothetical protein
VAGRAPSDPDRSGVPSAAYSSSPPSPAFPRRPLRQLLDQPGTAVSRRARRPDGDTDTLLLTPPGADGPRFAAKVPATRTAEIAVEREARMLVEVRRLELGHLRATVPRFVQLCEQDGRVVLVASAVPGRDLAGAFCAALPVSHARCRPAELSVAAVWLARFQEATARGSAPLDLLPHELIARLDRRAREDAGSHDARKVVDRARGVQELLARHEAPRSAVHGNFRADQVLVDTRTAEVSGVLGWRRAATRGEPLVDVGRFAVTHPAHRGARGSRAAVPGATLLTGHGPQAEQARRFVVDGLARLALPETLWRPVAWAATAALLAEADADVATREVALMTRLLAAAPDPTVAL